MSLDMYNTTKSAPNANRADIQAQGNPSHDALEEKKPLNTVKSQPPLRVTLTSSFQIPKRETEDSSRTINVYLVDEEYFVTAFVPSDTACLASSPGRMSRTLTTVLVDGAKIGRVNGYIRCLDLSR